MRWKRHQKVMKSKLEKIICSAAFDWVMFAVWILLICIFMLWVITSIGSSN